MKKIICLSFLLIIILFSTCTRDKGDLSYAGSGYPPAIAQIILNKCAVAGCHNDQSKEAAGNISFDSWNKMFEGGTGGAVVIPYRPDFSTLFFYINTYADLGTSLLPNMPVGAPALSREEVTTIKNWISNGAPDNKEFVKFSDNPQRKKAYAINRGCDIVTVIDAQSGLAMRYISVGNRPDIEAPVMVKVSPDNQYWYVLLSSGTILQKFRTSDDHLVGEIFIGSGFWTSFTISGDSKKAFIIDEEINSQLVYVDLDSMKQISSTKLPALANPYNCVLNGSADILYITTRTGNFIYKVNVSNPANYAVAQVSLETGVPVNSNSSLDPYDIIFSPDESNYFITCSKSTELRIMQTSNDSLLASIPLSVGTAQMDVSKNFPYLFVTCMGSINGTKKSAVYIINYQTFSLISSLYAGFESRGVVVDDPDKKVFIANRNETAGGPASHHAAACAGKNGYISAIDMNTLQLIPSYKPEVSVDPYSMGITH